MSRAQTPVWFFDLDNTLHDASWRIFGALDHSITDFMARRLNMATADADALRRHYWLRYGATLAGLARNHGIDYRDYLDQTHNFIDTGRITDWVRAESRLARSLKALPGRKILLTNAPSHYAAQVVNGLGIGALFDRTIGIDDMTRHGPLRPKPSRFLLHCLLAEEAIAAKRAILVEDSLANLKSARAVGWRTVFISRFVMSGQRLRISRPSYVDLQVKSIAQLARRHRMVYPDAQR